MTIFPTLYPSSLWLVHFATGIFVPLNLPYLFLSSPSLLPLVNHLFVFCIYDSIPILLCWFICFSDSMSKWNHLVCISFLFFLPHFLLPSLSFLLLLLVTWLPTFVIMSSNSGSQYFCIESLSMLLLCLLNYFFGEIKTFFLGWIS